MHARRFLGAAVAAALILPAASLTTTAASPAHRGTALAVHGAAAASTSTTLHTAADRPYDVVLASSDWWYTATTFTAVGEVTNDTDVPVTNVRIRAIGYAADGSTVADGTGAIFFAVLDPGESGSFRVDVPLRGTPDQSRITVDDWTYGHRAANHYFETTGQHTAVDAQNLHVSGTVTNVNTVPASGIRAVATIYDPAGNVAGAAKMDFSGTIQPGGTAQFSFDVEHVEYTYTPDVYVEVESTSDPQTAVTFLVDRTTFAYGGSTDVTGAGPAGARVAVQLFDQPTARWQDVPGDTITTGSDGSYSLTLTPSAGTSYRVVTGSLASVPVAIYLLDKVTLKASATKTTVGKKVTLSGKADPVEAGSRALIQRKVGSTWKTLATVPINTTTGAFVFGWKPTAKGTYVLRAYVGDQSLVFPGSSSSVTVIVK